MACKDSIDDGNESCHAQSMTSSSASDGKIECDDDNSSSVKVVVRVRPIGPNEVGFNQCIDTMSSSRLRKTKAEELDTVRIGGEVRNFMSFTIIVDKNNINSVYFAFNDW
jgi:hypothetical protein